MLENHWFSLWFCSNWVPKCWKTIGFIMFLKQLGAEVLENHVVFIMFGTHLGIKVLETREDSVSSLYVQ